MDQKVKKQIVDFYAANKASVDSLAAYLDVPPLWIVCLFHLESSLTPTRRNSSSGAVGLNQMMPATLRDYNLTPEQYRAMSVAEQIEIMKRFFKPAKGLIKRAGDLYLYNFYPVAVVNNWAMNYPIGKAGDFSTRYGISLNKIYEQNKGLDFNKDGNLTRGDIEALFESRYDELVVLQSGEFFFTGLANRPEDELDRVAPPGFSPADRHFSDPQIT